MDNLEFLHCIIMVHVYIGCEHNGMGSQDNHSECKSLNCVSIVRAEHGEVRRSWSPAVQSAGERQEVLC